MDRRVVLPLVGSHQQLGSQPEASARASRTSERIFQKVGNAKFFYSREKTLEMQKCLSVVRVVQKTDAQEESKNIAVEAF